MAKSLIKVRDVAIGYGGPPLLDGLNFDIEEGSVFVILGGSGCGKSTLLRHLVGLQTPLRGRIEVQGRDPAQETEGSQPTFGVMFQHGALFSSLTLAENVGVPLQRWTNLSDEAITEIALARLRLVSLGGFENHLPSDISGGMQKRAGIARALAMDPSLLFLDEPSAGLDPVTAVELDDLLITLRESLGVTTVIVTHELASIFRIASDCIMLDRDAHGIIARGDPRLLSRSEDESVHRFFNRLPEELVMSGTANHWKLGLFVVLGSLALMASLVGLGAARLERETVESVSYFDTDIHGLVVGAPVNFRGVPIGQVASIGFAPDQRHVKITQIIYVDAMRELGLNNQVLGPENGPFVPPDLRVRLESSILTGVAFLEGDFIDLERYPVPEYPFPTPWNTVHAVPSTIESLEEGMVASLDQLPELLTEGTLTMRELRATMATLQVEETQTRIHRILDEVERQLLTLEEFPLVAQGLRTFEEMEAGLREVRTLASELRSEEGPMLELLNDFGRLGRTLEAAVTDSDLPGTTAALRDVSTEVSLGSGQLNLLIADLRQDLQEVRTTLEAFRTLADTLERDPSSLLYGRTPHSPLSGD